MNLLLTDTLVVTCDEGRRTLQHGAVAVRGNLIAAVGFTAALESDPAHADLVRMPARGLMVLPGLVNAHTHTVLLALRGTVEDWDGEAVYRFMSPISYAMSAEERSVFAALGCLEAIRSGSTALVDPFRHVAGYAGAMAGTGRGCGSGYRNPAPTSTHGASDMATTRWTLRSARHSWTVPLG